MPRRRGSALWHVRECRGRSGWVNEKVIVGGTTTVLTDTSLVIAIPEGYRAMVYRMRYGVLTLNDKASFELGYTDKADGSGTFTPLTCKKPVYSGNVKNPFETEVDLYVIPIMMRYSDGARAVTFRVTPDADDTTITCGVRIWLEAED